MKRITLDFPPSANRYWRKGKHAIYLSEEATRYKELVKELCQRAGMEPVTGEVTIVLRFFRPTRRGDLDNRIKICLDALQGLAYADDSQIVEIHATRCEDPRRPRVEVEIEEV